MSNPPDEPTQSDNFNGIPVIQTTGNEFVEKDAPVIPNNVQTDWTGASADAAEYDLSNVVPFKAPPPGAEPRCAFCGLPKSKVKGEMLIRSQVHDLYICQACITVATQRLKDSP